MASTRTPKPPAPVEPALHPADAAITRRNALGLPDEWKPHCDAVLAGFRAYESGNDEAARTALAAIPLGSPFLEWKVLLRGLIAYTNGDDARALENWGRLSDDRLPARLAAPLRAKLDPNFRPGQSHEQTNALLHRAELLVDTPLAIAIAALRNELRRGHALVAAFRHAESIAVRCKHDEPVLFRRIARLFYRAILDHGEPSDISRYRKVFGQPPDDPEFLKLEAQRLERTHNASDSNQCWSSYERWLAGNPLRWPDDLVRRARAVLFHRIAENIADDVPSLQDELFRLMNRGTLASGARNLAPAPVDPVAQWEKACELAPGWEPPARALFEHSLEQKDLDRAMTVARRFLDSEPTAIWAIDGLADSYAQTGQVRLALDLRLQALRAKPLDRDSQQDVAEAYFATARVEMIAGNFASADATLLEGESHCRLTHPTTWTVLRSAIARSAKRIAEADALQAEAESDPNKLTVCRFQFAASAVLAKWKPAQKKLVDQAFAAALAEPANPVVAAQLIVAMQQYIDFGIDYRGRATHQKKIVAYAIASADSNAPVLELERVAMHLQFAGEFAAMTKFATVCSRRFPLNPIFPMAMAQALIIKAKGKRPSGSAYTYLRKALRNAERSPEPHHKLLVPVIEAMEREVRGGIDDFFF